MNKVLLILVGVAVVGAVAVLLLLPPRDSGDVAVEPVSDAIAESVDEMLDESAGPVAVEPEPGSEPMQAPEAEPAVEPEVAVVAEALAEHVVDGTIAEGEYPHRTTVIGVDVYWKNDAEQLNIGLVSPGTGYVSIGLDPEDRMLGANYIIAFMQEGELHISDDFGSHPIAHTHDTNRGGTDDIVASAGAEWPDQTVVEFIIPLDSGDSHDKVLVPGNTYPILVAYHDLRDGFSARHSGRGSGEITLDSVE